MERKGALCCQTWILRRVEYPPPNVAQKYIVKLKASSLWTRTLGNLKIWAQIMQINVFIFLFYGKRTTKGRLRWKMPELVTFRMNSSPPFECSSLKNEAKFELWKIDYFWNTNALVRKLLQQFRIFSFSFSSFALLPSIFYFLIKCSFCSELNYYIPLQNQKTFFLL